MFYNANLCSGLPCLQFRNEFSNKSEKLLTRRDIWSLRCTVILQSQRTSAVHNASSLICCDTHILELNTNSSLEHHVVPLRLTGMHLPLQQNIMLCYVSEWWKMTWTSLKGAREATVLDNVKDLLTRRILDGLQRRDNYRRDRWWKMDLTAHQRLGDLSSFFSSFLAIEVDRVDDDPSGHVRVIFWLDRRHLQTTQPTTRDKQKQNNKTAAGKQGGRAAADGRGRPSLKPKSVCDTAVVPLTMKHTIIHFTSVTFFSGAESCATAISRIAKHKVRSKYAALKPRFLNYTIGINLKKKVTIIISPSLKKSVWSQEQWCSEFVNCVTVCLPRSLPRLLPAAAACLLLLLRGALLYLAAARRPVMSPLFCDQLSRSTLGNPPLFQMTQFEWWSQPFDCSVQPERLQTKSMCCYSTRRILEMNSTHERCFRRRPKPSTIYHATWTCKFLSVPPLKICIFVFAGVYPLRWSLIRLHDAWKNMASMETFRYS